MRRIHPGFIGAPAALLLASAAAQAALIDRGGGFVYDDVLDITWTQVANINGLDTWANQLAWADSLSLFDSDRGVTWGDWRLASVDVDGDDTVIDCSSTSELACRDNEYGYLFHQYGIKSSSPGPFTNVQSSDYWSGTEFRPNAFGAWVFRFFGGGTQAGGDRNDDNYAWAVRDGDVAAAAEDTDGDGVTDANDNCVLMPNGPDAPLGDAPIQYDSDGDGFGNACDPDLNNDGIVNAMDLGLFRSVYFSADPDADFNGDGIVNAVDLGTVRAFYFGPPGPSGLVP